MYKRSGFAQMPQRSQTGDIRPYECDGFDRIVTHRSHLNIHQQTHTGERPYKCDECDKTFQRKFNLKTHQRIHNCERPCNCNEYDIKLNKAII